MNHLVAILSRFRQGGVLAIVVAVTATACSSPGTTPDASVSADPVSTSPEAPLLAGDLLEPGTYALGYGLNGTITVPAGWANGDARGVLKGDVDANTFQGVVFWPFPSDFDQVYSNPCNWSMTVIEPPVGPTVDDLANALAAQELRGDAAPTDVSIDGYQGKLVAMSVPDDIDFADCDLNEFRSWNGRFHQGPGQIDDVYILDIDGKRQVLIVHHMSGVTDADLAEQQAIVDSIDFLN